MKVLAELELAELAYCIAVAAVVWYLAGVVFPERPAATSNQPVSEAGVNSGTRGDTD